MTAAHHKKIDFFIIGAPKAGTDSLRHWINRCTGVRVYGPSEPNYFCTDALHTQKDIPTCIDRVISHSRRDELIGEKSTWYLCSPAAISNIHAYNPDANIIILHRDHVGLVRSLHGELLKLGAEDIPDLGHAWEATLKKPERVLFENRLVPNYPQSCKIGEHAASWIKMFGHKQVLLTTIDDLNTSKGRARVGKFLKLSSWPSTGPDILNQALVSPRSRTPASRLHSRISNIKRVIKMFLHNDRAALPRKGVPGQMPKTSDVTAIAEKINKHFSEDAILLAHLLRDNKAVHDIKSG